ncbi:Pycsar system effector family protein [Streptomyces sp. 796.1]|uniref:Pycsar system effector family protein n=1 Tax=Streptomyces sp. 796.1 TaxID=3163029 RepID=UPI0039C8FBD8
MHTPDPTNARIADAHAEVRAEIARADTKSALLLAYDAGLAAGTWATAHAGHPAATITAGLAGAATLASALLLLAVVLPRLRPPGSQPAGGFPRWAGLTAQQFRTEMTVDQRDRDTVGLARLAVRKMALFAHAVRASAAATILLAAAGLLAVAL